jgi:hypothetical protein
MISSVRARPGSAEELHLRMQPLLVRLTTQIQM